MSPSTSRATLSIDAIGFSVAVLATALAAAAIIGTTLLTNSSSPRQQAAELDRNKHQATALEREVLLSTKRLAELSDQYQHAVHLLPASHVNERLGEITSLASEFGVSISTIAPAQPAPAPETKGLVVSIKLAGAANYADLTRFLHTLHDRFRDTALTSLALTAPPLSAPQPARDAPPSRPATSEISSKAAFTADLAWHCVPNGSAVSTASADATAKP